jgi:MFS family permease
MTPAARLANRLVPHRRDPDADGFDGRLVAPMILGSILNPINSSIIAVSLIPIGRAFDASPVRTAWLVSALYVATAIGQPVVGRLVDLYGPRRLYLIGTALVGVAGVLGLLAPTLPALVAARVLLGFGTCSGYPASMYLIRSEARRTGRDSPASVLTVLAVANQTIAVIGPTLGGLLIGVAGWRSTFAINLPLSLACLWLGARRLPSRTAVEDDGSRRVALSGLDLPGIGLFAATLVAGLLFLMDLSVGNWWMLALAATAGAAFVVRENRAHTPFIDLRVLRGNRPLVATYARNLLTAVVSYTFLYGFTQWLEEGHGLSPSQAGLVLLPMFVTAIVVSGTTGRHPELRGKLVVGAVAQVVGCGMLLLAGAGSSIWLLVAVTVVMGLPQGLNNLANQNAVYRQADAERMGSSAGLLRTSMYLGAVVASAANGAFLRAQADTGGLHALAWFAVGAAVLMLVITVPDRSLRAR